MAKYKLPVIANSFIELEAKNLEEAISKAYNEEINIPGIDMSSIDSWEIDRYSPFEKNDETVVDNDCETYIVDIIDKTEY